MIGVDTNVLVYAHREDSEHHVAALTAVRTLAERSRSWALPWPCLHEFLAIVTHPRIYEPPSTVDDGLAAVADLLAMPGAVPLAEGSSHLSVMKKLVQQSELRGRKIHDARVAALCLAHGVSELWTADRDFSYFPQLKTRNPLLDWR